MKLSFKFLAEFKPDPMAGSKVMVIFISIHHVISIIAFDTTYNVDKN
jgi:hypothetical protein